MKREALEKLWLVLGHGFETFETGTSPGSMSRSMDHYSLFKQCNTKASRRNYKTFQWVHLSPSSGLLLSVEYWVLWAFPSRNKDSKEVCVDR